MWDWVLVPRHRGAKATPRYILQSRRIPCESCGFCFAAGGVDAKVARVDLATIANIATALTVLTGVIFGLIEAQRARRARQDRAALAAVQTLLTSEWMKSMVVVQGISDGLSASEIESDSRVLDAAHAVAMTLEGLGYAVYARIVPLQVAADLVGGTARLAWRKLRPYVEEERRRSGSQKSFEWFQWLATQLERHSPGKTDLQIGAHEAYRDWKP